MYVYVYICFLEYSHGIAYVPTVRHCVCHSRAKAKGDGKSKGKGGGGGQWVVTKKTQQKLRANTEFSIE